MAASPGQGAGAAGSCTPGTGPHARAGSSAGNLPGLRQQTAREEENEEGEAGAGELLDRKI